MRRMKTRIKILLALVFAALTVVPGLSQTSLGTLFDFSASIESLAEAAQSGKALPVGRYVLLTGTLRAVEADEEGIYSVRVELAAGQWVGTSQVILRTVFVDFSGESYRSLFDRESPSFIRPGSSVLAVARVADARSGEDGVRKVVLEGAHIRRLDN